MGSMSRNRCANLRTRRRFGGLQSAELLVVLPVLGLVLLGTVQMGTYFINQHRLQSAADLACRTGIGQYESDAIRDLAVSDDFYSALGDIAWADQCELNIASDDSSGDRVLVTVTVPSKAVVPDLLGWFGLGLGKQVMTAQASMRRI